MPFSSHALELHASDDAGNPCKVDHRSGVDIALPQLIHDTLRQHNQ